MVELYGSVLNDNKLSDATKGRFLGIGSSCPSRPEVSVLCVYVCVLLTLLLRFLITIGPSLLLENRLCWVVVGGWQFFSDFLFNI